MGSDTVTAALCFLGGCVLSAVLTGALLPALRQAAVHQRVREDGPPTHLAKSGTPSMGGIAIVAAIVLAALVFLPAEGESNGQVAAILGFTVAMALVGFADDYAKLVKRGPYGFRARYRVVVEILLCVGLVWYLSLHSAHEVGQGMTPDLPPAWAWVWPVFAVFVLFGTANAVNLTDGLDGLAAGLVAICAAALALAGGLVHEPVALLSLVVSGAAAGFLWFNAHPAKVFMGDVGSLGLGAALGAIAVAARIEFFLALVGFVFVVEALSVIGQVVSFRTTGKRILRMAPLHHHLELSGWPEQTIVVRFWVIGGCLAWIGLVVVVLSGR
jgi:phospho-N-acetylmuramoyl-pentapeptide-transferase